MKKRVRSSFKTRIKTIIIESMILSVAFLLIYSVTKSAYYYAKPIDISSISLVKKAEKSTKIKPTFSSGLIFPHQNKTIYESLKSSSNNTNTNTKPLTQNNRKENHDQLLIAIREENLIQIDSTHKSQTLDPFSFLEENKTHAIILFETTTTRENAKNIAQRLCKQYTELQGLPLKIVKINNNQYIIKSAHSISSALADSTCVKMHQNKEICHIQFIADTEDKNN